MRLPDLALGPSGEAARLRALRGRPLNFDPEDLQGDGWERDDYRQPLPAERPGPPERDGSWQAARRLSHAYAFADPALVEARFDRELPLEEREMLLVLHALGLRIYAGVRVGGAGEDTRDVDGRPAQVSFWNYRTLEGHVESGQRDFEVRKWLDTGEVEFRTHAVSRPAETTPLVRTGFLLLGRHKQVEFGRRACARMALLTDAALRRGAGGDDDDGSTFDGRLLAVYLRDHEALLVGARQLAGRMAAPRRRADVQAFAAELRAAVDDDLAAVRGLLRELGGGPSRARDLAVTVGERLGRLKLNGRLLRPSPLSAVVELDGCRLLLEKAAALWSGLDHIALGPADAAERAERARRLVRAAEPLRLDALAYATRVEPGEARA
jgi:uncharacterized protein (UPF0548 family)